MELKLHTKFHDIFTTLEISVLVISAAVKSSWLALTSELPASGRKAPRTADFHPRRIHRSNWHDPLSRHHGLVPSSGSTWNWNDCVVKALTGKLEGFSVPWISPDSQILSVRPAPRASSVADSFTQLQ